MSPRFRIGPTLQQNTLSRFRFNLEKTSTPQPDSPILQTTRERNYPSVLQPGSYSSVQSSSAWDVCVSSWTGTTTDPTTVYIDSNLGGVFAIQGTMVTSVTTGSS